MTEKTWLMIFGRKLEQLMNDNGMTQRELADELRVDQSAISNYIAGKRMPAPRVLINLKYTFNINIDELAYYGCKID